MYKVLVPVSGGKDSQACLKMAVNEYKPSDVLGLFCDTQFEHPLTYKHIENISKLYGVEIKTISGGSVVDQCIKNKRFPSFGARFCTDALKTRETKQFCKALAEKQGGFQVWYGMRHDESSQRAKRYAFKDPDELYAPNDVINNYPKYLESLGVMFRLPIIDWTDIEVMQFLDGNHNPLYDSGFPRVGCFPCLASGDAWKAKAFTHDEFGKEQYIKVLQIEETINKSVWTSSIGQAFDDSNQGCLLCSI